MDREHIKQVKSTNPQESDDISMVQVASLPIDEVAVINDRQLLKKTIMVAVLGYWNSLSLGMCQSFDALGNHALESKKLTKNE